MHPERIVSKRPALLEPSGLQMQAVSGRKCRSLTFDDHPRQEAVATSLVTTSRYALRYAGLENNHAIAKTNRDSPLLTHTPSPAQRFFCGIQEWIQIGIRGAAPAFNSIIVLAYLTAVAGSGVRLAFRVGDHAAVRRFIFAADPTDCSVHSEAQCDRWLFFLCFINNSRGPSKNIPVASKSIER